LKKLELLISESPPVRRILTSTADENGRFVKLRVENSTVDGVQEYHYHYRLFRGTNPISQNEVRRVGVTQTEVALAFPIDREGVPVESTQLVHAFLPIRDFGFKVLSTVSTSRNYILINYLVSNPS
jgi:hypothetical protein